MTSGTRLVALLLIVAATSCGGDGVIPDPGNGGDGGGGGTPAPSFASLTEGIFVPRCAIVGCHAASEPQQGLNLSSTAAAYASLVGIPSVELPAYQRVHPRNPDDSYLVMKLGGDARITGDRMPQAGPLLTPEELDGIRAWIDAGAPNN